jgi:hypothetical protein
MRPTGARGVVLEKGVVLPLVEDRAVQVVHPALPGLAMMLQAFWHGVRSLLNTP